MWDRAASGVIALPTPPPPAAWPRRAPTALPAGSAEVASGRSPPPRTPTGRGRCSPPHRRPVLRAFLGGCPAVGLDDRQPQLVIVPGLGLDARSWAPTLRHLGWPSRVLLLPGYGLRAPAHADLSPRTLAEAVLADDSLGRLADRGPIVLAGHSSGCQVAARVAAQAGE